MFTFSLHITFFLFFFIFSYRLSLSIMFSRFSTSNAAAVSMFVLPPVYYVPAGPVCPSSISVSAAAAAAKNAVRMPRASQWFFPTFILC